MVTKFCQELGVKMKSISIVHPQDESTNKVILKELKKKLNDAKGLWEELLYEITWS